MSCRNKCCSPCEVLDCTIDKLFKKCKFPGLSMGVIMCDEIVYTKSIGKRNDLGDPIDEDTIFQCGGATLPLIATWFARQATLNLICLYQRVFRFMDPRKIGEGETYRSTIGDILAHLIQLTFQNFFEQLNTNVKPRDRKMLFENFKFAENQIVSDPSNGFNVHQKVVPVIRLNYELPSVIMNGAADHLGVDPIVSLKAFYASIGLGATAWGKTEFLANPNHADPMNDCSGNWKSGFVLDPLPYGLTALAAALSINQVMQFLMFVLNDGCYNDQEIVSCLAMDVLRTPISLFLRPPDPPTEWFTTPGWFQRVLRTGSCSPCGDSTLFTVSFSFNECGTVWIYLISKADNFACAVASNSLNPYAFALAFMAYYLFVCRDCKEAKRQYKSSVKNVKHYICASTPRYDHHKPNRDRISTEDIVGEWHDNYGGKLIFEDTMGGIYATLRTYAPFLIEHIAGNFYRGFCIDSSGIPRPISFNFTQNGAGMEYNEVRITTLDADETFYKIGSSCDTCYVGLCRKNSCCGSC